MAVITAIATQKGGVGKTTTSVNLAACVAASGKRVLLADTCPQGNCSSGLSIDKNSLSLSVYDVLVRGTGVCDAKLPTLVDGLDILPAPPGAALSGAEIELMSRTPRETLLKEALASVQDEYDYIFIDCPPSLGLLTINALTAADNVLIPIQCEFYALEGMTHLLNTIKLIKKQLNPTLAIEGVVMTMYDSRTNLSAQVAQEVKNYFRSKVHRTMIPRNIRLAEAPSYGLPIHMYDPKCAGALAYAALAEEYCANNPIGG